jgi:hypothetical protein
VLLDCARDQLQQLRPRRHRSGWRVSSRCYSRNSPCGRSARPAGQGNWLADTDIDLLAVPELLAQPLARADEITQHGVRLTIRRPDNGPGHAKGEQHFIDVAHMQAALVICDLSTAAKLRVLRCRRHYGKTGIVASVNNWQAPM